MMTKRNLLAGLLLTVIALTAGCAFTPETYTPAAGVIPTLDVPTRTEKPGPSPTPPSTPIPTPEPDPAAEALAGMTLEQKAGQLLVAGILGTEPGEDARAAIQDYQVGGVILFGRNVESAPQLAALNNGLKALNGDYVPLFLCVDEEGGRVSRMPPEVTDLPSAYDYIRGGGDGYARGAVLAEECAAFGFNLDFAPSLDIWSNPENTVIGDRAFGTDWDSVTGPGTECAYAMMDAGVVPVVKHFPGHGDTLTDSHVGLPVVEKSAEELLKDELIPFDLAVKGVSLYRERDLEGVSAVMVAHILMTAIDQDHPASLSYEVVTGLLREQLGFDGMVCTDDLTMAAVSDAYGMGEAAVLAVEAGCDLLLVCHKEENLEAAYRGLLDAVASGRISEARLNESVYRILKVKAEYGLDNRPVEEPDVAALNEKIEAVLP